MRSPHDGGDTLPTTLPAVLPTASAAASPAAWVESLAVGIVQNTENDGVDE